MKTLLELKKISVVASLFITFIFVYTESLAQDRLNFYSIRDGWNSYYQQHPEIMFEKGAGYKDFKRWERFWLDRTYGSDTARIGDFTQYREAMIEYKKNKGHYDDASILAPNWRFSGPTGVDQQVHGLVNAVYVDTVNDESYHTIYVGTNSSGIWKTTDGGNHWSNVSDYNELLISGINNITGDPNNGNILYAATGGSFPFSSDCYGIGIIRSTDYGQTWSLLYPPSFSGAARNLASHKVLVDPSNSQRIYGLVYNNVVRSRDGGQSWDTIFTAPVNNAVQKDYLVLRDIEMKPGDPDILYIASDYKHWAGHRRPHVWKITNATQDNPDSTRLDNLFPGYKNCNERFELAVSPACPSAIYVLGNDTIMEYDTANAIFIENMRVKAWKSDDNGQNWKKTLDQGNGFGRGGINYFRMELMVSPTDTGVVYFGGFIMARLTYWNLNSIILTTDDLTHYHIDTRDAVIVEGSDTSQHGNNDIIFAGNDGGISKTINGSHTWTNINGEGLDINQFWGIGSSDANPDWIGGGTQDNSFFIKDPVAGWLHTGDGDMGDVLIDYNNPAIMYSSQWIWSGVGIVCAKSVDYGKIWGQIFDPTGDEPWIANWPFVMNPKNPKSLYVGAHHIYKSENSISSFTQIPIQLNGNPDSIASNEVLCSIAIAPADTNNLYACYSGPHWHTSNMTQRHKLMKTMDEGVTWTDLTKNVKRDDGIYEVFGSLGLTSIEISPTNKDSVWITFGGFSEAGKYRVMVTGDGGDTWSDYSQGLPNLPVNCIKYWRNGESGLFLGMDVGVFYRDKNDSIWQSFNTGLPTVLVTDIEIVDAGNVMRIGTYGRGIWEADLSCDFASDTLLITSDTTWATDLTMDRSVKVKRGATLTINSVIKFPPQAKTYIEPGAALLVKGGTLTNACYGMWQGIEVWGNSRLTQNNANQGYINLSENAVVENARIAISTCQSDKDGDIDWRTTGGIIIAKNCTFRNNYKAVQFLAYSHPNTSNFRNVTFETTAPFIDGISTPSDFVSLYGIHGAGFHGCTFRNTTTTDNKSPEENHGNGIYSINSHYTIDDYEYCLVPIDPCPDPQIIRSSFSGLHYGVKAVASDPAFYVNIKTTDFDSNYRSVYLDNADYSTVNLNTFHIPAYTLTNDSLYCLYLNNCTGYSVQENYFKSQFYPISIDQTPRPYIGIIVNNSGEADNEIYNNRFDSIPWGIIAQDKNRNANGSDGLRIKCNDFTSIHYDIAVVLSGTHPTWGIALYQGDSLSVNGPAGNTFSPQHQTIQRAGSDIDNDGARFKYYHHIEQLNDPRLEPDYSLNVYIKGTIFTYDTTECCLSQLSGGGALPDDLKEEIAGESDTISSIGSLLSALIDGGSTEALNSEILNSLPSEALELRDQLLNESPYLSDTAMQSAISKEEVLPNAMIRDVLVANPQSATSDRVLNELDNRVVSMPDSMLAEILAGENIISAKEALETNLASHRAKRSQALYNLIRYYKSDTINPSSRDSLISLLQRENSLPAKYQLAFEYLETGDTGAVNSTLNGIPGTFNLTGEESIVHNEYLDYFAVLKDMAKNGRNIFSIDSSSLANLLEIYTSGHEPVKSYTRNILIGSGNLTYYEPILLPENLKSSEKVKKYNSGHFEKSYLKVFPNPARQFVIAQYNLKEKFNEKSTTNLIITDMRGLATESRILIKQQDQELINTSGYVPGSYTCTLVINGKRIDSKKFVIAR